MGILSRNDQEKRNANKSNRLTTFNVVVSVLCTFVLLCKATMFVLHVWYPILSTIVNTILVAMWIVSVVGQAGPDHSDPEHPSNIPWYLSKSCDLASPYGKKHYCLMAKGTFAVTVFLLYASPFHVASRYYSNG